MGDPAKHVVLLNEGEFVERSEQYCAIFTGAFDAAVAPCLELKAAGDGLASQTEVFEKIFFSDVMWAEQEVAHRDN